jgi:hypothetical protein
MSVIAALIAFPTFRAAFLDDFSIHPDCGDSIGAVAHRTGPREYPRRERAVPPQQQDDALRKMSEQTVKALE